MRTTQNQPMRDRQPIEIQVFGQSMHLALCQLKWKDMVPTADPQVRHCQRCDTDVQRLNRSQKVEAPARCVNVYIAGLEFSGAPLPPPDA